MKFIYRNINLSLFRKELLLILQFKMYPWHKIILIQKIEKR